MGEISEVTEASRRPEIVPLQPNEVKSAIEVAKTYPPIYQSEWTQIIDNGAVENPVTKFLADNTGLDTLTIDVPITGNEPKDNYIRAALLVHRILRESGRVIPIITQHTVEQYKKEKEQRLADSSLDLGQIENEFAGLTDGVVNDDVNRGAADMYNLVKIATENGERDTSYDAFFDPTSSYRSAEEQDSAKAAYRRDHRMDIQPPPPGTFDIEAGAGERAHVRSRLAKKLRVQRRHPPSVWYAEEKNRHAPRREPRPPRHMPRHAMAPQRGRVKSE